tara:strand:+ start:200 stop:439 length:240 start_codon:yes stop_codon:yes gene_type:complete
MTKILTKNGDVKQRARKLAFFLLNKMKIYKIEYWFLSFIGDEDSGYDYDIVEVEAISPKQALLKAKQKARRGAKHFTIL